MQSGTDDRLNVLVADSHLKSATLIENLCKSINGLCSAGIARSEQMLVVRTKNTQPDLVILNLCQDMGGIGVIDTLKRIDPDLNIVIVHPKGFDSNVLVSALEAGAYECIEAPADETCRQYKEFRLHLLTVTGLLRSRKRFFKRDTPGHKTKFFMPQEEKRAEQTPLPFTGRVQIVAIAASTGGPEILSRIFSILPKDIKVPILLVQHIPENMTRFFAKSLNRKSELDILEAKEGQIIQPAKVYIAPGGSHMTVFGPDANGQRQIRLNKQPMVNGVRPSADVLFESIAKNCDQHVLAVVLTGMGEDGRHGIARLKEQTRCTCITQEAQTCVVYGMPRAVDEAGLSDECLDPLSITQKIVMSAT